MGGSTWGLAHPEFKPGGGTLCLHPGVSRRQKFKIYKHLKQILWWESKKKTNILKHHIICISRACLQCNLMSNSNKRIALRPSAPIGSNYSAEESCVMLHMQTHMQLIRVPSPESKSVNTAAAEWVIWRYTRGRHEELCVRVWTFLK